MTDTVDQATAKIQHDVHDSGFLGTDNNSHVKDADKELAGLPASDANKVVGKLSDGDLKAWADDVNSGGIFGAQGLSAGEKKDLFNTFAQKLDGDQLARVSAAFGGSRDDVIDLGRSVAQYGTADAKVEYVKQLAGKTIDQPNEFQNGFFSQTSIGGDREAIAIGEVLSSLKGNPQAVDKAFSALNGQQLNAVVRGAEGQRTTTYTGASGPSNTTDARLTNQILSAAGTGNDPAVKARVFESGAKAIGDIKDSDQLLTPNVGAKDDVKRVTDGLTQILNSDTTGVTHALKVDQLSGKALTSYLKEVVSANPSAGNQTVGTMLARLQQGNDLSQNPFDYVNQTVDDGHGGKAFVNAETVGYFSGGIQAAINSISSDEKTQGDILGNVLNTAVSVGTGWKVPTPVKLGAQVVNGGIKEAVREVVADVTSKNKTLADALFQISLPHDANGKTAELASDASFLAVRSTVVEQNR
ncbi:MAG: hypothetical protein J0I77_17185 [Rudaea sp.]|uniref:hypothetical protein n=1 Tax=unclassified Rudaea TaxID=2627037 RepID=UPI0010F49BEB|nr:MULTISPECIES: hypothetical protein [unclassified Rudaea]MBN8887461.1 hypothetical protein [Rudaea sp.]